MPFDVNNVGTKLGTASKTLTLDLSVWANIAEVCNRKKWSLVKCIEILARDEVQLLRDLENLKESQIQAKYGKNPNKIAKPLISQK